MSPTPQAPMTQTNLGPSEASTPARGNSPTSSGAQTSSSSSSAPPNSVTIRLAAPSDAAAIAKIGWDVFYDTFAHTCSKQDMDDYLAANFAPEVVAAELVNPAKTFSVAVVDGAVAAFSALTRGTSEPCVDHIPEAQRVELQRMYAASAVQGRGVAKKLFDAMLRTAREMGFKYVFLGVWEHNLRARAFYEKFGFAGVGSHDFFLGTERQTDDIFLLEL